MLGIETEYRKKRDDDYCGHSILFFFIEFSRSVRALFLIVFRYLCRISARAFSLSLSRSVLLALDWLEKLASFSGRFFHRSEQGDASKFDESKCARLARLDYYTRRETRDRFVPTLNHVLTRMKD